MISHMLNNNISKKLIINVEKMNKNLNFEQYSY